MLSVSVWKTKKVDRGGFLVFNLPLSQRQNQLFLSLTRRRVSREKARRTDREGCSALWLLKHLRSQRPSQPCPGRMFRFRCKDSMEGTRITDMEGSQASSF